MEKSETVKLSKWWLTYDAEWLPLMISNAFLKHLQDSYFKTGTLKESEFKWFLDCPVLARVKNTDENIGILQVAFTEHYFYSTLMPPDVLAKHLRDMRRKAMNFTNDFLQKMGAI
jgi:hypothetical protein